MTTGERRLKINNENEDKLEGGTITRYIKAQHLKCHEEKPNRNIKRMEEWIQLLPERRERPRKKWPEDIENVTRILRMTDWKSKYKNREKRRKILSEARNPPKCVKHLRKIVLDRTVGY